MEWKNLLMYWPLIIFIAFCTITLIQLFYYVFFFFRLAFYNRKAKTQSLTHPVSVIVCARDEANNLENNLPDVLMQDYPYTHEVIIVNDNSHDDTKYFLDELQKTFKQLKPVTLAQEAVHIPGKKFPLSVGIKTAKHEVLLLTDADCVPASKKWISKMQDGYTDGKEIVLGYGAFHKRGGLLNKLVRFETFHTALQYLSYALAGIPYMGVGRNLSYKKDLFFRNKGFSSMNHIPGGDDDLFINKVANKKNVSVVVDRDAFTLSEAPRSFGEWWRQKSRHYSTSRDYKPKHKFYLGLYAFSYLAFYPLLAASILFFNWWMTLSVFGLRFVIQSIVWFKTMRKLNEQDLYWLFWLLDIWQFFYYIIFSITLAKKPRKTWK